MRPTDEGARGRRRWEACAGQQASQALEQAHSAPGDRQRVWLGQGSGEHGKTMGSVGAAAGVGVQELQITLRRTSRVLLYPGHFPCLAGEGAGP